MTLICSLLARKGSPLILGVREDNNEYFISSDASAVVEHTRRVVYLNDGEQIVVRRSGFEVKNIDDVVLQKEIHELEWDLEQIEKEGYPHFMLKEIVEQPESLSNCMRGRISADDQSIVLGGLIDVLDKLREGKTHYYMCLRHVMACRAGRRISNRRICPYSCRSGVRK